MESAVSSSKGGHSRDSIVIFFVRLGVEMPQSRIDQLAKRAIGMGAMVVKDFESPNAPKTKKTKKRRTRHHSIDSPPPHPTHLVIQESVRAERVAEFLKFESVQEFEQYLREHHMQCALDTWITRSRGTLLAQLDREERWWKVDLSPKKVESPDVNSSEKQAKNSQSNHPKGVANPSAENSEDEKERGKGYRYPKNVEIAEKLKELGKLHQQMPLDKLDSWKAYSLNKAAGRIENLDFEITLDAQTLKKVSRIQGVGESVLGKIKDVLTLGTIERIEAWKHDPERQAMKVMMGIWGVGPATASELIRVHQCRSIEDVRRRLSDGELYLERNQKIGVECYEDFLEEMARDEVEAIGNIVKHAIHRQFTDAEDKENLEITIMGSFRRGKPACGDVDVLITHRRYHTTVPPTILGMVVEDLLEKGQMAYHLTFISGMKVRQEGDHHAGGFNDNDDKRVKLKSDKETGSSYMGVFNSPTIPGKRRRVDIKFYPHRERAFAWLYFTGNGYFNRSMRLYTDVKKGYRMNDHGLFFRGTNNRVIEEAASEKEVFDFLGLAYKEPWERDGFDAVVLNDDDLNEDVEKEIIKEEANMKWID